MVFIPGSCSCAEGQGSALTCAVHLAVQAGNLIWAVV